MGPGFTPTRRTPSPNHFATRTPRREGRQLRPQVDDTIAYAHTRPPSPATASPAEPYGVPHASLATDPARHTFTFVRPQLDPRLTVVVESSDDMKSWKEESGAPAVLTSGTTHQRVALTSTAPTTARWWRLKALYKED
jgi:hypothetical protein